MQAVRKGEERGEGGGEMKIEKKGVDGISVAVCPFCGRRIKKVFYTIGNSTIKYDSNRCAKMTIRIEWERKFKEKRDEEVQR